MILALLFLVSCNDETVNAVNPMSGLKDAIENTTTESDFKRQFFELLDAHRSSLGITTIIHSDIIDGVANQHSINMAMGIVNFGTTGSGGRCTQIKTALGQGTICAELVGKGYKSPQQVFNAWKAAPVQRQKMESTDYTHAGIGFQKSASGIMYWTHIYLEIP